MIMDITTLTLGHTVISIVAIAAGLVVVGGLIAGVRIDGWTGIFLVTTALTSITGFFSPSLRYWRRTGSGSSLCSSCPS
jgi:hypothetical protein